MKKRLLSILIILSLLVSLTGSFAAAEEPSGETTGEAPEQTTEESNPSDTDMGENGNPAPDTSEESQPEEPKPEDSVPTEQPETENPAPEVTPEPEQESGGTTESGDTTESEESDKIEDTDESEERDETEETSPVFQDIVIYFTSDLQGALRTKSAEEGKGLSYSKVATLKNATPNSLLIDTGNHLSGTPYADQGTMVIQLMNQARYDVAVFGNQDLLLGLERLLSADAKSNYPYLSCNLKYKPNPETGLDTSSFLKEYTFFDTEDGIRVAFIGITDPRAAIDPMGTLTVLGGADGKALYDAVQSAIDAARTGGANYIIAIGSLGDTETQWTAEAIIENTFGLSAFIDGNFGKQECKQVNDVNENPVILMRTGPEFSSLGQLTIQGDGTIKSVVCAAEIYNWVTPDRNVKALEDELIGMNQPAEIPTTETETQAGTDSDAVAEPAGATEAETENDTTEEPEDGIAEQPDTESENDSEETTDSESEDDSEIDSEGNEEPEIEPENKENQEPTDIPEPNAVAVSDIDFRITDEFGQNTAQMQECNLGDLVADAVYWYMKTQTEQPVSAAILGGQTLRAGAEAGVWYDSTLAAIVGDDRISVITVTGAQLLDILENGAEEITLTPGQNLNGSFIQTAGLTYQIRLDSNPRVSEAEIYSLEDETYLELNEEAMYSIAVSGGLPNTIQGTIVTATLEALTAYLREFAAPQLMTAAVADPEESASVQFPIIQTNNSPLAMLPNYGLNYQNTQGRIHIQCLHSSYKLVNDKTETCSDKGYTGDQFCNTCQTIFKYGEETDKLPHSYQQDKGSFSWSPDYTSCIVTATCDVCGDEMSIPCKVTDKTMKAPTTTKEGLRMHYANASIEGKNYSQNKQEILLPVGSISTSMTPRSGHVYDSNNGTYSWKSDYSACILTATCLDCGQKTLVNCTIKSQIAKVATTSAAGLKTVEASAVVDGVPFKDTKSVVIPAKQGPAAVPVISGGNAAPNTAGGAVPTGDSNNPEGYLLLAALSAMGVLLIGTVRKKYE